MSNSTTVTMRLDADLKKQAEQLYSELGMNLTTAFNIFLRQSVREGAIPFNIKLVDTPNAETRAAIEDVKQGQNVSRTFDSVDDLMRDLNA